MTAVPSAKRTFSPEVLQYLSEFDLYLLATNSDYRRMKTRTRPKLFALVYCLRHLTDEAGHVSLSEAHEDWFAQMESWVKPVTEPRSWRRAFVAPRSSGKTTTWFLLAPAWSGAHGWSRFFAAFADSANQAETHLATFKAELKNNSLLRQDYPDLCEPARRAGNVTEFDNRSMLKTKSGFVFSAKGIDSASLGLKVGDQRPDVLIGDDLEPPASNYSTYQAARRLSTLTDAILPLNERARVVVVGTVTMPGSLVHQLVKTVTSSEKPEDWIVDERFTCYHYPAIITNDDGSERSQWPEKWPLEWLQSIRHTRSFSLNYQNMPAEGDFAYWSPDDFIYGTLINPSRRIISIDPAVTDKRTSDETGVAVVSYSVAERKACVDEVHGFRLKGEPLRQRVLELLRRYPDIKEILFETNNGGTMMMTSVLHDMPVTITSVHATEKKELRAERLLSFYRRSVVLHAAKFNDLELQQMNFPNGLHDDLIDCVGQAIDHFARATPPKKLRTAVR